MKYEILFSEAFIWKCVYVKDEVQDFFWMLQAWLMDSLTPLPQTMAKVITSMLKFPPDQAQKVLDKEDTKTIVSIRHWSHLSPLAFKHIKLTFLTDNCTVNQIHLLCVSLYRLGYDECLNNPCNLGRESAAIAAEGERLPWIFMCVCVCVFECVFEHTLGHKCVVSVCVCVCVCARVVQNVWLYLKVWGI